MALNKLNLKVRYLTSKKTCILQMFSIINRGCKPPYLHLRWSLLAYKNHYISYIYNHYIFYKKIVWLPVTELKH